MNYRKPVGRKPKIPPSTTNHASFDSLIDEMDRAIVSPSTQERAYTLSVSAMKTMHFYDLLIEDVVATQKLIGIARAVRCTTGTGRLMTEQRLMEDFATLSRHCCEQLMDDGVKQPLAGLDSIDQVPPRSRPSFQVLQALCQYAFECLAYNQPHDAASGRRRSSAFEILSFAIRLIDLPDALLLARKSLSKPNSPTVYGALLLLQSYYTRVGWSPEDELVEKILKVSARTGSRSIACSALNMLVEIHVISEMEALDHMDAWKENHWRR